MIYCIVVALGMAGSYCNLGWQWFFFFYSCFFFRKKGVLCLLLRVGAGGFCRSICISVVGYLY